MSIERMIHESLIEKGETLALAESCTGGLLAARFAAMPDASKYFLGCLVTYSDHQKHALLKVSNETLVRHGAVSRETANEMLLGLMKQTNADYGIVTTGVAGPSGGTKEKPVGTVFIGLEKKGKKPRIIEAHFEGDRAFVMTAACDLALEELRILVN